VSRVRANVCHEFENRITWSITHVCRCVCSIATAMRFGVSQWDTATYHRDSRQSHLRSALACSLIALASLESGEGPRVNCSRVERPSARQPTYESGQLTLSGTHGPRPCDWLACTRILALSFFLPRRGAMTRDGAISDPRKRTTQEGRREREREREREEGRKQKRPHARRDSAAYISASG